MGSESNGSDFGRPAKELPGLKGFHPGILKN